MPSTEIRIYKGIPFTRNYSDVLYADMKTAYTAAFTVTGNTYQRPTRNVANSAPYARAENTVYAGDFDEGFYECNYIAFKNPGGRWYYGFIDYVVKANNGMGEIHYTIDSFQTWFVGVTNPFNPCLVKRMVVGTNEAESQALWIDTEEPVTPKEYVTSEDTRHFAYQFLTATSDKTIVIIFTYSQELVTFFASKGMLVSSFSLEADTAIRVARIDANIINVTWWADVAEYIGASERYKAIMGTYLIMTPPPPDLNPVTWDIPTGISAQYGSINGYGAHNSKVLWGPYRKYYIRDMSGDGFEVTPQTLLDNDPLSATGITLHIATAVANVGKGLLYLFKPDPEDRNIGINTAYSCPVNIGASVPLYIDSASLYWSTQGIQDAISVGAGVLKIGAAAYTGSWSGGVQGISEVGSSIANMALGSIRGDVSMGKVGSGLGQIASNLYGVEVIEYTPHKEELAEIDDFFTKYGYAINKITQPLLTGRPSFNYVMIEDPIFNFTCPTDARDELADAFARGVRLWHSASIFGDYSANTYNTVEA